MKHDDELMGQKEVRCPNCKERGGVRARVDAYVNKKIIVRRSGMSVFYLEEDVAEMDDTVYECFTCGESLEASDIEKENGVEL